MMAVGLVLLSTISFPGGGSHPGARQRGRRPAGGVRHQPDGRRPVRPRVRPPHQVHRDQLRPRRSAGAGRPPGVDRRGRRAPLAARGGLTPATGAGGARDRALPGRRRSPRGLRRRRRRPGGPVGRRWADRRGSRGRQGPDRGRAGDRAQGRPPARPHRRAGDHPRLRHPGCAADPGHRHRRAVGHDVPGRIDGTKVEACIRFAGASGHSAAIGALGDAVGILAGRAGTTISAASSVPW